MTHGGTPIHLGARLELRLSRKYASLIRRARQNARWTTKLLVYWEHWVAGSIDNPHDTSLSQQSLHGSACGFTGSRYRGSSSAKSKLKLPIFPAGDKNRIGSLGCLPIEIAAEQIPSVKG